MIYLLSIGQTGTLFSKQVLKYNKFVHIDLTEYLPNSASSYEEFEMKMQNLPDKLMSSFSIDDEIFVISSPDEKESGSLLKVLEQLNEKFYTSVVLLIQESFGKDNQKIIDRNTITKIMQEIARSGLIKELFLISQDVAQGFMLTAEQEQVYDAAAYALQLLKTSQTNKKSIQIGDEEGPVTSRIKTLSLTQDKNEVIFYNIKNVDHKNIAVFSKDALMPEKRREIKDKIKNENVGISLSLSFHEMNFEQEIILQTLSTSDTNN